MQFDRLLDFGGFGYIHICSIGAIYIFLNKSYLMLPAFLDIKITLIERSELIGYSYVSKLCLKFY